ncbi:MAG: hypothetical protein QG570_111 [Patescibacteria group bacterium]|nr:hypothetical protein [Patescibacteria group bacterium]
MFLQSGLDRSKSLSRSTGDSRVYDVYFVKESKGGQLTSSWVGAVTIDEDGVPDPRVILRKVVGNPPRGQTMSFIERLRK